MKTNRNQSFKRLTAGLIVICLSLFMFPTNPSEAASSSREAFKQELRQMLYSVDTSTHDISKYKLSPAEVKQVFTEIKQDSTDKWMAAAYYSNLGYVYTYSKKIVKTFEFSNVDSDVKSRYEKLIKNVERIKAGVEPSMKDLDKIIYFHDAIDDVASYKFVAYESYGVGGILGNGIGVCAGYTKALNLFLEDQGIKTNYIEGLTLNHGWTSVCLDGQWYHIDSTWDDTRTPVSGKVSHQFLLRNDSEFAAEGKNSHGTWQIFSTGGNNPSTSTKYTNWYVHDIVGKMAFENGYWYYVDTKTNSIMQNTAEGGKEKVILNGKGRSTITLIDATATGITYKEAGVEKKVGYEGETVQKVEEDAVSENIINATPAAFYIILDGDSAYTNIGTGYIARAVTSKDGKFVSENIVNTPDMTKWIPQGKTVEYTAITASGAGKYFVKGYVKDKPEEVSVKESEEEDTVKQEEVTEITVSEPQKEPVVEGTKAVFYLVVDDGSLKQVGNGLITSETGSSSKNDAIAKRIVEIPDVSSYLGEDGYIVWIKLTVYDAGKTPTVRGEVRHK